MSVDSNAVGAPATTGVDAVDYDQFAHFHVEGELLVYGYFSDDAWLQSDAAVDLAEKA